MTPEPSQEEEQGKQSAKKRRIAVVILALIAVGCFVVFCILPRIRENRALAANAAKVRVALPVVVFVTPQPAPDADLTLPGNVEAITDSVIAARTTGYVRKRYVDIGDRVKAGQLLAEIEAPDVDASVRQADQQTLQAQAGVREAESDVANKRATVAQYLSNVQQAQANVEQAGAQVADAEAKWSQAISQVRSAQAQLQQQQHVVDIKRATLLQAEAALHLAVITLKRNETLLKSGYIALEDVDQSQAAEITAQAAVNSAEADVRNAEAGVRSAQELVESGRSNVKATRAEVVAARRNELAIEATVTAAQATVSAAQANVRESEQSVVAALRAAAGARANAQRLMVERGFSRVVAPFDGVITARNVDVGALITAGAGAGGSTPPTTSVGTAVTGSASATSATPTTTPSGGLFGLASTDMLRVLISVPQTFSMEMRQGIKVSIEISELPGLRFQGIVSNVSGAIDTVSRTLLTEIHVPNRNGRLLPGMYVLVHFILPKKSGALLIPTNALTYDANGTRVAIVTPASVIHEEPIVVGRDFGPEIEITKGLNGQEKVVTNPSDSLVEGLKVQAKASPPPAGNQPQQPGHPNETIQHGVTPVKLPIRKPGISDFPENDELDALKGAPHDNSPLVALDHSVRGDRPRR